jgi:uncharacterized protein (DUF983 family)
VLASERKIRIPEMIGPFDCKPSSFAGPIGVVNEPAGSPAQSLLQAIGRAVRNRCPACGSARLFPKFLKPMLLCPACRLNWSPQRADDFPAYVAILLTGHIIVPAVIVVEQFGDPPMWVHLALWLPLATVLMIGLLQPAKGAVIAIQWWFGMHGFEPGSPAHRKPPPHDGGS